MCCQEGIGTGTTVTTNQLISKKIKANSIALFGRNVSIAAKNYHYQMMRCWLSCKGNPVLWINCFLINNGYFRLSRNLSVYYADSRHLFEIMNHEVLGWSEAKKLATNMPQPWNGNVQPNFWVIFLTLKLTFQSYIRDPPWGWAHRALVT